MTDRKNAVHALERAWNYIDVQRRTYSSVFKNNSFQTFDDVLSGIKTAIDLLKEQEPRVMTLSGVRNLKENTPVWLEDVDKADVIGALFMRDYSGTKCVDFAIVRDWEHERVTADYMDYGIRWRVWTSRPDEKRRAETPWEQEQPNGTNNRG